MDVNRIAKAYYENGKEVKKNYKKSGTGFYESLSENINGRNGKNADNSMPPVSQAASAPYFYRSLPLTENDEKKVAELASVSECEVRELSYSESDYVKVYAAQGYVLLAQADERGRSVYIEKRLEDGSLSGYEIELDKIAENTTEPIEQAALEAWGKLRLSESAAQNTDESGAELTMKEALNEFYEFIQDRIKNGPVKYSIGNSEFSQAEWDKFISGIDAQIDEIKEETKERLDKLKEEENRAKAGDVSYIDADSVSGLNSKQIKKQAISGWREELDAGVPYGYLAKDGVIEYNGVIFVCDKEHKALHLGDTSDMNQCIRIPLSQGGCLIVNRDNLGDLSNAIGMFSPEDVNLILRAIAQDAKVRQMKQEIDDETSGLEVSEERDDEEEL